jgi:hypothetical protein
MYFETLLLKIYANKAGWTTVEPPFHRGESGVDQKFSFLAIDGTFYCGFDIYNDVCEEDVLKAYKKRQDTGVYTVLVSLSGRPGKEVARFADDHGISILGPADIDSFFALSSVEVKNPSI